MNSDTREVILRLLRERALGATICPSEVARTMATDDEWRKLMPTVHSAVDDMAGSGIVGLSWKGLNLDKRDGPYRISLRLPR